MRVVTQAFNSSLFQPGMGPGPSAAHDMGQRAFGAGPHAVVHNAPSEAGSEVAQLERGCMPGSNESTSSNGRDSAAAGMSGVLRLGATTSGAPVGQVGAMVSGQRSQDLAAGMYYQPQAMGHTYMGVPPGMVQGMPQGMGQGMPQGMGQGMPQGMGQGVPQGLGQGMPQGMGQGLGQGMAHYGSLPLAGAPIGAGNPPIGGSAGYLQFAGAGSGACAPIGRASVDWFAGAAHAGAAPGGHLPPLGGARIGRSSFEEDRLRRPSVAASGGGLGSGLSQSLIGSGAGPLIGGSPAPLSGSPLGQGGVGPSGAPLVGATLPVGMAANPLALGVGQIPLGAEASLPYTSAPISAGEAAAVDFGSALYNQPGPGAEGVRVRRTSSLEASSGPLDLRQGYLMTSASNIPPSVFSASDGSDAGARPPSEAGRSNTGSFASSGARGDPLPALARMGAVAEDAVFTSGGEPRKTKARALRSSVDAACVC